MKTSAPSDHDDLRDAIRVVDGESQTVMASADAILIASGTATLEAMLYKTPMVVAYRWSKLNHMVFSPWINTPHIALPNLLAGERLVPGFVQGQAVPSAVARAVENQLKSVSEQTYLRKRFTELSASLSETPDGFVLHRQVKRIVDDRQKMAAGAMPIWLLTMMWMVPPV